MPPRSEKEPYKGSKSYTIQLGISFEPFKGVHGFYRSPKGRSPFYIPEDYDYALALRKRVSLFGIEGFIDVITDEDPNSWLQSLIGKNCRQVEKPMGETHFESIYRGKNDQEYTEEPLILRFAFLVHNPNEYAKLLNSEADVKLGKEQYLLAWNQNRPLVKRCMQYLEEGGNELLVIEKNLFNYKEIDECKDDPVTDEDIKAFEKMEFGRITFIWLPEDLKKLRRIKLSFHRLDDGGEEETLLGPITPDKKLIPVLV